MKKFLKQKGLILILWLLLILIFVFGGMYSRKISRVPVEDIAAYTETSDSTLLRNHSVEGGQLI